MKKISIIPVLILSFVLMLSACSNTVNTENMDINISGCELYSKDDLESAVEVIEDDLANDRSISSILRIEYCGDTFSQDNIDYCNTLNHGLSKYVDCAVFDVDFKTKKHVEVGLEPNETYQDFKFYLARTDGGNWEILTCGYA